MRCVVYQSPVGPLRLVSDGAGLSGLYFEDHKAGGKTTKVPPVGDDQDAHTHAGQLALMAYFAGQAPDTAITYSLHGTAFQRKVWQALQAIPWGGTTTYAAIATAVGCEGGSRAVGGAVGRNPVSILIPCHRVIGSSGRLTGFAGGLNRKQHLLAIEGQRALL